MCVCAGIYIYICDIQKTRGYCNCNYLYIYIYTVYIYIYIYLYMYIYIDIPQRLNQDPAWTFPVPLGRPPNALPSATSLPHDAGTLHRLGRGKSPIKWGFNGKLTERNQDFWRIHSEIVKIEVTKICPNLTHYLPITDIWRCLSKDLSQISHHPAELQCARSTTVRASYFHPADTFFFRNGSWFPHTLLQIMHMASLLMPHGCRLWS